MAATPGGREMGKYVKGKSAAPLQWCPSTDLANKTISKNPELVFFIFKKHLDQFQRDCKQIRYFERS